MRKYIIVLLAISFVFSSCEEVIDLKLKSTPGTIVIQGNITDQPGPYTIALTKTVDFDDASIYPPVSDALVIISDNYGIVDTLIERSAGNYITSKIKGTPGYTYKLKVFTEDQTFEAVSTMPNVVLIDSIYTEKNIISGDLQVGIYNQKNNLYKNTKTICT